MKTAQEVVIGLRASKSFPYLFAKIREKKHITSQNIGLINIIEHSVLTFSKNNVSVLVLCLLTSFILCSFPIILGFFWKITRQSDKPKVKHDKMELLLCLRKAAPETVIQYEPVVCG